VVVLDALRAREGSLALVETFTGGQIAARIAHLPGAEKVFRRGLVARDPAELAAALGLDGGLISGELSRETAEAVARAMRQETGASHALAVLIEVDDGPDRIDFGGSIHLAIASDKGTNPAAHASMAAAIGCAWVRSSSASTASAATSRASPSPNAPISSGSNVGTLRSRFAESLHRIADCPRLTAPRPT
jgi:nicotinamide mononucleotide (NMN) deamidase PncC